MRPSSSVSDQVRVYFMSLFFSFKSRFFCVKKMVKKYTDSGGNRLRRSHESSLKSSDRDLQHGDVLSVIVDTYS